MELTKGQGVELKASQRSAPEAQLGRDPHKSRASLWSGCQSVESYSIQGKWVLDLSVCPPLLDLPHQADTLRGRRRWRG